MIPNILHFVFGMTEDFGGKPFSLIHYLSIKSAVVINKPDCSILWYKYIPHGYWWEKSKLYVDFQIINEADEKFGDKINRYAHRADIVRLNKLIQMGGIYLDLDIICIKPFTKLTMHDCVWGEEESDKCLCNGVILAQPDSEFLGLCLEGWKYFEPWMWNEISCYYPAKLAKEHPGILHIENKYAFHWPLWRPQDGVEMFINSRNKWPSAYCRHLWESKFWDKYLKKLSIAGLMNSKTNFAKLVKPFLSGEADE
ncbi:MAG: hypothetical protein KQH53_08650 [Desulfarculaceae bacterium]|nr:hypothetical protein [Desulfarculaceae bacterium]